MNTSASSNFQKAKSNFKKDFSFTRLIMNRRASMPAEDGGGGAAGGEEEDEKLKIAVSSDARACASDRRTAADGLIFRTSYFYFFVIRTFVRIAKLLLLFRSKRSRSPSIWRSDRADRAHPQPQHQQ